jgi:hypothetical protein
LPIHDPDTGYCQGIAFVFGASSLKYAEEDAFCPCSAYKEYGFQLVSELVGLQLRIYQFEQYVTKSSVSLRSVTYCCGVDPTVFVPLVVVIVVVASVLVFGPVFGICF